LKNINYKFTKEFKKNNLLLTIISLLFFTLCTPNNLNTDSETTHGISDIIDHTDKFNTQPEKVVIDFLLWYRENESKLGLNMVNNSGVYDSTKFYSVNFDATEEYLNQLIRTGYISEKYTAKWRRYFLDCDKNFKNNPTNEGPPSGFDYDLVTLSQDFENDLKEIEKVNINSKISKPYNALVTLSFQSGYKLSFSLSGCKGRWLIDTIEH